MVVQSASIAIVVGWWLLHGGARSGGGDASAFFVAVVAVACGGDLARVPECERALRGERVYVCVWRRGAE